MERQEPTIPGSGNGQEQRSSVKSEPGERAKQAGKEAAGTLWDEARATAQETAQRGQSAAAGAASDSAHALEQAAQSYAEHGQESLARSASALAGKLAALAERLEHQSLDDLAREAKDIARSNPGLFIAGGLALGLVLSRFFKASSEHSGSGAHQSRSVIYGGGSGQSPRSTDTSRAPYRDTNSTGGSYG
jgi:hypothetical protein